MQSHYGYTWTRNRELGVIGYAQKMARLGELDK